MASVKDFQSIFVVLGVFAAAAWMANAGDPDILTDFIPPENSNNTDGNFFNNTDGNFFTFTGLRGILGKTPQDFTVTKAGMKEFAALNGQSVSMAVLQFPNGSVNPPHTHPRSAELLFLVQGNLQVGFVDTTNKLFVQNLQVGDTFLFPKGLVHYQYNADPKNPAAAISAFGSANAGTVSVPVTVFGTNIDDDVLSKAFKTDVATVQKLKAGFVLKP